jgi:integrase
MPRKAMGSVYASHGAVFCSFSLPPRTSFKMPWATNEDEGQPRRALMADVLARLRAGGHEDLVEPLLRQVAEAHPDRLSKVLMVVEGVLSGRETRAPVVSRTRPRCPTFAEVGHKWTSNALASEFKHNVKRIDQQDNATRLELHVYRVRYQPSIVHDETTFLGFKIGDIPMDAFTVEHADFAMNRLAEGLMPNVAAAIRRVCNLAVYPVKAIKVSPLPRGWAPKPNDAKEKSYLFPLEELRLLNCMKVPLVRRLLYGFMAREGPRKENCASLCWDNLTLEGLSGAGHIVLDVTKNGRGGSWALDAGTAEALRRWKRICPSETFVFPATALGGKRRGDRPMCVDKLAAELREDLKLAEVVRPKLFESSTHRLRFRAHDLRGTFVTTSLANDKTEAWVQQRTGHGSSVMINRYRQAAMTVVELGLGPLRQMHLAIPEVAHLGGDAPLLAADPASA